MPGSSNTFSSNPVLSKNPKVLFCQLLLCNKIVTIYHVDLHLN